VPGRNVVQWFTPPDGSVRGRFRMVVRVSVGMGGTIARKRGISKMRRGPRRADRALRAREDRRLTARSTPWLFRHARNALRQRAVSGLTARIRAPGALEARSPRVRAHGLTHL
jgi:hypothetical protein